MKEYSIFNKPVKVYGIPFFEEKKTLERVPEFLRETLGGWMKHLGKRCPGARAEFKTNSEKITVKVIFDTLSWDIGMSIYSCQSAYVYIGQHSSSRYAGHVHPDSYEQKECTAEFAKSNELEDVQIFLPRNEAVKDIIIGIEDGAEISEPAGYKYSVPIMFYGSSITEGGCCSKISNAYSSIISRRMDADFYNFGFSGSARGEKEMAEYINTIEKSVFVYDYDHNAPDAAHLKKTHEPFFRLIREKNPDLPVIMVTMPLFEKREQCERTGIIRATYENAVRDGDKNVYFVDGGKFFPPENMVFCTNDNTHPNDLGMFYMANAIEPVIRKAIV
ncbi:MAG: GDSL-type esterase/lipase family protein [Clostridia bacterium]|nr:GDSL-type esterase/lipase family protein [Clostridia bacterium]